MYYEVKYLCPTLYISLPFCSACDTVCSFSEETQYNIFKDLFCNTTQQNINENRNENWVCLLVH